jgi:DNA-binding transcriptional regulator YhcF (GntR family)
VREVAGTWNCTVGTVQTAYQELARQGLVTSRAGQGTKVVEQPLAFDATPLRRAMLVHRAEAFLLEVLTSGYGVDEVEQAVRQALDRWRLAEKVEYPRKAKTLRFAGSHDLVIAWLASHFPEIAPGYSLQLNFSGSLGGLIALAEGRADLAGSHLWDEDSNSYNVPFVRRLFPGKRIALVNLAYRRMGLIVPKGNPDRIESLRDLARPGLRFVNRLPGSGTRVWLEVALGHAGEWYLSVGQGMGEVLTMANQEQAYTLSDRATYLARSLAGIDLEILVEDDLILFNPYGVIAVNPVKNAKINNELANAFIDWIISIPVQEKIGMFGVKDFGQPLFKPDSTLWLARP